MNLQIELYLLFLEKMIEDLDNTVFALNLVISAALEQKSKETPTPQVQPYPYRPWEEKWGNIQQCPKCGIKLDGVMSYSCNNIDCPTGMGPVWCKS